MADPLEATTAHAIRELLAAGLRLVMMTGDSKTMAATVARTLGIDEVIAEVLPDQKAAKVKELHAIGRVVAIPGDRINDALALLRA